MNEADCDLSRRRLMQALAGLAFAPLLPRAVPAAGQQAMISKAIPSSGEDLPVIGMGTSRTFDVADDPQAMAQLAEVMQIFFASGGRMIDSSPMYGGAEAAIGRLLRESAGRDQLFAATKVWTNGRQAGIAQMEASRRLWGVKRFDLIQIHNLVDWPTHLATLQAWKSEGLVRYTGITTSHGRYHDQLEQILQAHDLDFVQLSYNISDRAVERRLLPLARERGIAVIVNRPYQRGGLFRAVRGKALPAWAGEIGCESWGQFFLKFAVSHPAVTCAIPATAKPRHMADNMGALRGALPDRAMRQRMIDYFQA